MYITICYYKYTIIYHYISSSIIINHYICTTIYHYISLYIYIRYLIMKSPFSHVFSWGTWYTPQQPQGSLVISPPSSAMRRKPTLAGAEADLSEDSHGAVGKAKKILTQNIDSPHLPANFWGKTLTLHVCQPIQEFSCRFSAASGDFMRIEWDVFCQHQPNYLGLQAAT